MQVYANTSFFFSCQNQIITSSQLPFNLHPVLTIEILSDEYENVVPTSPGHGTARVRVIIRQRNLSLDKTDSRTMRGRKGNKWSIYESCIFEQGQSNREKDAPIFVEFIRARHTVYAESFAKSDRMKHFFQSNTFIDIVIRYIHYFIQYLVKY